MFGPKLFYFLPKVWRTFCYAFLQDTEILCKINGLEVFLGYPSQKYFLNLLLQKKKNTPKPNQNRKQTKAKQDKQEKLHKFLVEEFWRKDCNWLFTGNKDSNFTCKQGSRTFFGGTHSYRGVGWTDKPRADPWRSEISWNCSMEQGHPSSWSSPNPSFAHQSAKSGTITR